MSFHQLWLRSIQLDEYPPQTGSLSILLKPFDYISNYLPSAQILWWCSHTRRGDATFVSQQVHFHSTTVQQISLNILPPGGKLGQKIALKIVRLRIGFTFQEMSSGLWVSFRRRVSSGDSDHFSFSPSLPHPPSSLKLPKMCHSRMSFCHGFSSSHLFSFSLNSGVNTLCLELELKPEDFLLSCDHWNAL